MGLIAKAYKPMTTKEARALIEFSWGRLTNKAQHQHEARDYLERALKAATDGEKRHRRGAWAEEGRYRVPVAVAARYFVLKWFREPSQVKSAREAVSLREDCLYASALGQLDIDAAWVFEGCERFALIDYVDHMASPDKR